MRQKKWLLAEMVPSWSDLFDEQGHYIETDGLSSSFNEFLDREAILRRLGSQP